MQAQSGGQAQNDPSVVSFVLTPSIVRDQSPGMKKLYLPSGARMLKLRLRLKGEVEYKSYQVTVLTAEGAERWSQDMLQAATNRLKPIHCFVAAGQDSSEGDYELRLNGHAPDGTLEETGDYYYLSVERK